MSYPDDLFSMHGNVEPISLFMTHSLRSVNRPDSPLGQLANLYAVGL
ncbi:hypothetical protein [Spirulina sp. 06S082]|nr:hypothetical protein [Spirulina sp. 06S082]MEA5470890.1 hypothetical protein [Spirulina sp. 06S082]